MKIEVVGYKGVVGGATYTWLTEMQPYHEIRGRDKGDAIVYSSDIAFICVPEAFVEAVCTLTAPVTKLLVIRSTVTPGTCEWLQAKLGGHVCHVPEFLREATAVIDEFNPSYVLIGACCENHGQLLRQLYVVGQRPVVVTNCRVSEMVKIATNNYLACLISFWNEIDGICEASGLSGHEIGAIASMDDRVVSYGARYHHKYGGKCLPKEIDQMIAYARSKSLPTPMLSAVKEVNEWQEF